MLSSLLSPLSSLGSRAQPDSGLGSLLLPLLLLLLLLLLLPAGTRCCWGLTAAANVHVLLGALRCCWGKQKPTTHAARGGWLAAFASARSSPNSPRRKIRFGCAAAIAQSHRLQDYSRRGQRPYTARPGQCDGATPPASAPALRPSAPPEGARDACGRGSGLATGPGCGGRLSGAFIYTHGVSGPLVGRLSGPFAVPSSSSDAPWRARAPTAA